MKISKTFRLNPETLAKIDILREECSIFYQGKRYPQFSSDSDVISYAIDNLINNYGIEKSNPTR